MIVVAGEALIDRIVAPDGSISEQPGGGPFNTARTIARLGVPAAFLGCLSTDASGRILRRALASDGVDLSMVAGTDAPTTVAVAAIDADGSATYRFDTNGTAAPLLDADAVAAGLAGRPSALHVGTLGLVLEPMATALAHGVATAPEDTLVMVDPNCRPAAILDPAAHVERLNAILGRADVVKASREDLAFLWPGARTDVAVQRMRDAGARLVLVTDGPRPVACHSLGFAFELPVPDVEVVDTVGAGDAFGGGFLAHWTEIGLGRDRLDDEAAVRDAVRLAIEVASLTCGRAGADPPRREELTLPRARPAGHRAARRAPLGRVP